MASEEERRSKLLNDYCELRRTHPELPAQLRDFQVKANVAENCTFENQQVDILCSALDETNSSHIMVALPTGYGKSLPTLHFHTWTLPPTERLPPLKVWHCRECSRQSWHCAAVCSHQSSENHWNCTVFPKYTKLFTIIHYPLHLSIAQWANVYRCTFLN